MSREKGVNQPALRRWTGRKQRGKLIRRHRPTEEIALSLIAALLKQQPSLSLLFDPFSQHKQLEAVSHRDDRTNNGNRTGLR